MDPSLLALLGSVGLPALLNLFGGGGQQEVSPQIDPVIRQQLLMAMLAQGRQNALVDPAASPLFGFQEAPPEAVPLRASANQLAFSLLPNFVRPSDSLFPGVGPSSSPTNFSPSSAFVNPRVGDADPGGSGPGGTLTQEDIERREEIHQLLAEEIAAGKVQVLPNGRIQLTGFTDTRDERFRPGVTDTSRIPRVSFDDLRNRLTPQGGGAR